MLERKNKGLNEVYYECRPMDMDTYGLLQLCFTHEEVAPIYFGCIGFGYSGLK